MGKLKTLIDLAVRRKKRKMTSFSFRRLAMMMGCSHVFLSQVLSGKKKFPADRIDSLVEILELDEINQKHLADLLIEEHLRELGQGSSLLKKYIKNREFSLKGTPAQISSKMASINYEEWPTSNLSILNPWYNIAILDLLSLQNFQLNFKWIGKRLGIKPQQAFSSWQFLVENKYVVLKNGEWQKVDKKIRLPTKESQPSVRAYHTGLLNKAVEHMNNKTSAGDFSKRLIAGAGVAANIQNIEIAKSVLHHSLYEATDVLTEGDSEELYQIYVLLFPVTE